MSAEQGSLPGDGPGRGPKGEQGAQGETGSRGERGRGLSRVQGRAIVVLFLIGALGGTGNLFWTSYQVHAQQSKWCSLIVTLDEANAAAAKKPPPGTFTAALTAEIHDLRRQLGCGTTAAVTPGRTP